MGIKSEQHGGVKQSQKLLFDESLTPLSETVEAAAAAAAAKDKFVQINKHPQHIQRNESKEFVNSLIAACRFGQSPIPVEDIANYLCTNIRHLNLNNPLSDYVADLYFHIGRSNLHPLSDSVIAGIKQDLSGLAIIKKYFSEAISMHPEGKAVLDFIDRNRDDAVVALWQVP